MSLANLTLSIVIPVYNSEETIGKLVEVIVGHLAKYKLEIVLANDGSLDKSHEVCLECVRKHPEIVRYLKLSKNFGEHNAVMAGLNHVTGDYALIIDDDFQNPPEELERIFDTMHEGQFDVLYTYYDEKKHSLFRNLGSWFNDRVGTFLLKKPKDLYLSSFKCVNRFLIDEIVKYSAPYPYIDGLILRVTRNIGKIKVRHEERSVGKSNYTLRKLVALWLSMFINFSITPLRVSFLIGTMLTMFGMGLVLYFLLDIFFIHPDAEWPAGWASLLVCIITFSGAQLMIIGLLGEYLGRLFLTDNGTPQFVVRELHGAPLPLNKK